MDLPSSLWQTKKEQTVKNALNESLTVFPPTVTFTMTCKGNRNMLIESINMQRSQDIAFVIQ